MRRRSPPQKKSLGQVFLKEIWPAEEIVDALKERAITRVLEIGPGDGPLTERLLIADIAVDAVEKDQRFAERLSGRLNDLRKFTIRDVDILAVALDEWAAQYPDDALAVVGNIPYNISTPILKWVLPHLSHFVGACFMTQLEFAERLASLPDEKSYGSLSVYCQLRADITWLCKVPKNVFRPVPKVDSAIFFMSHKPSECDDRQLRRVEIVCKAAFAQRRKKLRNGIKAFLSQAEQEPTIDLERRPQTLTPLEFVALARQLFPNDF